MNKKVLIYGASGGLGNAICNEFHKKGYKLVLAGRNIEKLLQVKESLNTECKIVTFSITESIQEEIFNDIDIVINAVGMDIRKPLFKQSLQDIQNQISLNLYGVINLTKTVLEVFTKRDEGQILHLGGFADGSWATPYYSVDVATRSGVYSFIESINLELNNKNISVQYFCPLPAETEAEKPYHKLWKSQGVKIAKKEEVAKEILQAIKKKKRVAIQGDFISRFISTKFKYQFPVLSRKLLLEPMGIKTMKYIDRLEEKK